jgi:spore maturation protein CgeB
MRVLIVDHYYPAVVDSIYGADQLLESRSYVEQRRRVDAELFGETVFEVSALQALGHEAWDALVNIRPLQAAWIREHGGRLSPVNGWGWRLRRGLVPWPRRSSNRWIGEALLRQVRVLRPDVVHVQCVDLLGAGLVQELREHVRLLVGQIAAPLNDERILASYHMVLSSLPNFVARFRAAGVDAEWLPLAFEPTLMDRVGVSTRDVPVSFVGSLSRHHRARVALLEAVAANADLSVWTGDFDLRAGSPLAGRLQGAAWGRQMYGVLARSMVTLNNHIDVAAGFANNLRLYEATGMGALLVTDTGSNLSDLFEVDKEVVAYDSAADCAEKVRHYLDHPSDAAAIAAAGQRRTLRDHTWRDRMARLVEMMKIRL